MKLSTVATAVIACTFACGGSTDPGPVLTSAPQTPVPPGCPGYVDPMRCPPFPTSGPGAVKGTVVERSADGARPLVGVSVWAWVQYASYGFAHAPAITDSLGVFRLENLPLGTLTLVAAPAGYDQPCANVISVGESTTIELVSARRPNVAFASTAPAVSGVVYEVVGQTRQPVAGARVYFESLLDLVTATTTTDEQGRYALCRLPAAAYAQDIIVVKDGYATADFAVTISGSMTVDILLSR